MLKLSDEIKMNVHAQYFNDYLTIHKMVEDFQYYGYFGLDEMEHNEAYEALELIINEGRELSNREEK